MAQKQYEIDLESLTEEEFEIRYKATKTQYSLLKKAIVLLGELHDSLSEPGPLELDSDVIDSTVCLGQQYAELLEQMEMAAQWDLEKQ